MTDQSYNPVEDFIDQWKKHSEALKQSSITQEKADRLLSEFEIERMKLEMYTPCVTIYTPNLGVMKGAPPGMEWKLSALESELKVALAIAVSKYSAEDRPITKATIELRKSQVDSIKAAIETIKEAIKKLPVFSSILK